MPCPKCGADSMDGAFGLCAPHFEEQREAIRERLADLGPVPTVKLSSETGANVGVVARRGRSAVSPAFIVMLVLFAAVLFYMGDEREVTPRSFRDAAPGETWQINSADVVVVNQPRIAPSPIEFAAMLVTGVPTGTTVMVLGGSRSDPWKYVVLDKGGRGLQGYILSETVKSARKAN